MKKEEIGSQLGFRVLSFAFRFMGFGIEVKDLCFRFRILGLGFGFLDEQTTLRKERRK